MPRAEPDVDDVAKGAPLRVLVAHNAYRQAGGEDSVVASEVALLRAHGHTVIELRRHNDDVDGAGRLPLAAQTVWSRSSYREAAALIDRHRPHVAHVHNTHPLLSPSVHWACHDAGVAVVQTLHNFRLVCPQAMFLRGGVACEDCLGRIPAAAILHGCYRGSRAQTSVLFASLLVHRGLGTWQTTVQRFIALSEFSRAKFIAGGLPASRLVVKPNFFEALAAPVPRERSGMLFVGRLAAEKGIDVLAAAVMKGTGPMIRVAGGGDAAGLFSLAGVQLLGPLALADVWREMHGATALVMPSVTYENFPRTIAEAYAAGLPVIASRLGSMAELVEHEVTGLLFPPGDAAALHAAMRWANDHPQEMAQMGRRARARYAALYTPETNHAALLAIYRAARDERVTLNRRGVSAPAV